MTQSLQLGGEAKFGPRIRRLNRLPIWIGIGLVVVFLAVIIYGLSSRGLHFGRQADDGGTIRPASSDADQLKQGIPDGIIGEPPPAAQRSTPPELQEPIVNPFPPVASTNEVVELEDWRARLEREQEEQLLRELHRLNMASIQADSAALDSPIAVDLGNYNETVTEVAGTVAGPASGASDPYAAIRAGGQSTDPNGQVAKENFFNQNIADLGYLPNSVVPQMSPYELKRGSVIPATLITGINSDLPGRITAQVSQNVYDSATGRHLLIPQGTKLFGRYDSNVSLGQNRVLAIWTDIVFPNGSTLQIGGMAGTDVSGYGGFTDKVDNHYLETFGSAILVALIGAGTEMMIPSDRNRSGTAGSAEDAARRSFAETFGQVSEQTLTRNLNVQPTLEIRPGYVFNVMIESDLRLRPYQMGQQQ